MINDRNLKTQKQGLHQSKTATVTFPSFPFPGPAGLADAHPSPVGRCAKALGFYRTPRALRHCSPGVGWAAPGVPAFSLLLSPKTLLLLFFQTGNW